LNSPIYLNANFPLIPNHNICFQGATFKYTKSLTLNSRYLFLTST
jgi:hypothetical protein